ncbi:complex I intermediate-associated protein 30 [Ilyonectria sp. MPI-CAGE-AT-0026]|nr:complex I intermediate-associated protein 30 [Ilyonectria sp. MPI-CAGE-AT-0026]
MYLPQIIQRGWPFLALFTPWDKSQWIASDDTVRGGKSRSTLEVIQPRTPDNPCWVPVAKFSGYLDYSTLGGAGFASQRTVDDWPGLDLSDYDSILLEIPYTDGKKYSINLKDTVLPPTADGREQATISWEFDFQLPPADASKKSGSVNQVVIKFADLVPTFRGTVQNDTEPLDLANIKRVNIMIRSFFAQQDGDFELHIKSIIARNEASAQAKPRSLL